MDATWMQHGCNMDRPCRSTTRSSTAKETSDYRRPFRRKQEAAESVPRLWGAAPHIRVGPGLEQGAQAGAVVLEGAAVQQRHVMFLGVGVPTLREV